MIWPIKIENKKFTNWCNEVIVSFKTLLPLT